MKVGFSVLTLNGCDARLPPSPRVPLIVVEVRHPDLIKAGVVGVQFLQGKYASAWISLLAMCHVAQIP